MGVCFFLTTRLMLINSIIVLFLFFTRIVINQSRMTIVIWAAFQRRRRHLFFQTAANVFVPRFLFPSIFVSMITTTSDRDVTSRYLLVNLCTISLHVKITKWISKRQSGQFVHIGTYTYYATQVSTIPFKM